MFYHCVSLTLFLRVQDHCCWPVRRHAFLLALKGVVYAPSASSREQWYCEQCCCCVIRIFVSAFTITQHIVRPVLSNRSEQEQFGTASSQLHDWLSPLTLVRQFVCSAHNYRSQYTHNTHITRCQCPGVVNPTQDTSGKGLPDHKLAQTFILRKKSAVKLQNFQKVMPCPLAPACPA